jgi:NAD+ synthase
MGLLSNFWWSRFSSNFNFVRSGLKVLCVEMPIHQHESHVSRGREHIKQLRNRYPNVSETSADLTSVLKALKT